MTFSGVVHSILGPVPVKKDTKAHRMMGEKNLLGQWNGIERVIRLRKNMPEATTRLTLGHEIMHMVLHDAGLTVLIPRKLEEAICDAFGAWFASAIAADKLSLK